VVLLLALVLATTKAPTAAIAITLTERIAEHDRTWKPTNVYCERPTTGSYDTAAVPQGTVRRSRCQWVAQGNLLLPDEIVTVSTVDDAAGAFRFDLVSTTYRPSGRRASCTVVPAAHGYRASCR
jgi:hypothetical protein